MISRLIIYLEAQVLIDNIHIEGTVSQIFDIGLSFYFMKCIKFNKKKSTKSSRFFVIKSKQNSETQFPPVECYKEAPKVLKGLIQY